jgi:hypothetical protein
VKYLEKLQIYEYYERILQALEGMVVNMEPIVLNNKDFKGARILYSNLKEGLELVKKDKIKSVWIWQGLDETRYTVTFDFLKDLLFIETLHFQVKLSKKSDLNGLYFLTNLRNFRWVVNNFFIFFFSRLKTIEIINTRYYNGIALENLTNLKRLYLNSVNTDNLKFLPDLVNLELLRIINGKFTSLEGLERCENLKRLDLRGCFRLVDANSTLQKLNHLESVALDTSNKYDIDIDELKSRVSHVGFS